MKNDPVLPNKVPGILEFANGGRNVWSGGLWKGRWKEGKRDRAGWQDSWTTGRTLATKFPLAETDQHIYRKSKLFVLNILSKTHRVTHLCSVAGTLRRAGWGQESLSQTHQ